MITPTSTIQTIEPSETYLEHVRSTYTPDKGNPCAWVTGETLANALKIVSGAVANKTTLPVLNNVLVSTPPATSPTDISGTLRLTATNLETSISVTIPTIADCGISIAIPAKLFRDTVKPKIEARLSVDRSTDRRGLTMTIKQGRNTNSIRGIAGDEFPVLPDTNTLDLAAVVPFALLKRAIKEVAPSAYVPSVSTSRYGSYTNQDRPQLASVYMEIMDSGEVLFIAADGFRMAALGGRVSEDSPTPKHIKALIPAKAFAELDVLDGDNISVYTHPNFIMFAGDSVEVTIRLTEGKYVDFMRVLPKPTDKPAIRFLAAVDDLLSVNKVIMPFAKDSANITRWQYQEDGTQYGTLTMSASAAEVGDALGKVGVFCTPSDGEPVTGQVALNGKFVDAVLKPHKGKNIVVELTNHLSPAILRIDDSLINVIYPMYLPNR